MLPGGASGTEVKIAVADECTITARTINQYLVSNTRLHRTHNIFTHRQCRREADPFIADWRMTDDTDRIGAIMERRYTSLSQQRLHCHGPPGGGAPLVKHPKHNNQKAAINYWMLLSGGAWFIWKRRGIHYSELHPSRSIGLFEPALNNEQGDVPWSYRAWRPGLIMPLDGGTFVQIHSRIIY